MVYIILVNYRAITLTLECINSLQKITYQHYKILVIDNSPDEGLDEELKKKFPSVIMLKSDKNSGFTGGNNIGIKYAMGTEAEYIVLLNNDTTVEKNFLEPLIETFKDKAVGLATGKIMHAIEKNKIWYGGGKINWIRGSGIMFGSGKSDNYDYDIKRKVTFASGCLFCLKKDVIEKVGMFDEDYFAYQEDTDYCVRLNRNGFNIIYEPKSIIYHQVNATTTRSSFPSMYYQFRNRLFFIQKNSFLLFKPVAYSYIISTMFIKSIYWIMIMKIRNVKLTFFALKDFLMKNMGAIEE